MRNFQGYFSTTFQELKLQFAGLSRTKVIFQDFPGPGILKKKIPGLSRRRVNPENNTPTFYNIKEMKIQPIRRYHLYYKYTKYYFKPFLI